MKEEQLGEKESRIQKHFFCVTELSGTNEALNRNYPYDT